LASSAKKENTIQVVNTGLNVRGLKRVPRKMCTPPSYRTPILSLVFYKFMYDTKFIILKTKGNYVHLAATIVNI